MVGESVRLKIISCFPRPRLPKPTMSIQTDQGARKSSVGWGRRACGAHRGQWRGGVATDYSPPTKQTNRAPNSQGFGTFVYNFHSFCRVALFPGPNSIFLQNLGIVTLTHHKLRQPQDIGSKTTSEYSIWWLGPSAAS